GFEEAPAIGQARQRIDEGQFTQLSLGFESFARGAAHFQCFSPYHHEKSQADDHAKDGQLVVLDRVFDRALARLDEDVHLQQHVDDDQHHAQQDGQIS
ncbi:hypothetical protein KCV01_g8992, partial [Aureobasidium melanogenum]